MLKESMGWNVYKTKLLFDRRWYFNIFPYIPKIVVFILFEVTKKKQKTVKNTKHTLYLIRRLVQSFNPKTYKFHTILVHYQTSLLYKYKTHFI